MSRYYSLFWIAVALLTAASTRIEPADQAKVQGEGNFLVELFEDLDPGWRDGWNYEDRGAAMQWRTDLLGVKVIPRPVSPAGLTMYRDRDFGVRITGTLPLEAGDYEFALRSVTHARLFVDDQLLITTEPPKPVEVTPAEIAAREAAEKKARDEAAVEAAERQAQEELLRKRLANAELVADEQVQEAVQAELKELLEGNGEARSETEPPAEKQMGRGEMALSKGARAFLLEFTGGPRTDGYNEIRHAYIKEEVVVLYRRKGSDSWKPLAVSDEYQYNQKSWHEWEQQEEKDIQAMVDTLREPRWENWKKYWLDRHAAASHEIPKNRQAIGIRLLPGMPHFNEIDLFIGQKLSQAKVQPAELTNDFEFVRRVYLDIWGLTPTEQEIRAFIEDTHPQKRNRLIDWLLDDDRWADPWVSYWEDVLAENPGIQGEIPNMSGPFKQWIHRSFVENRGYDRFATELILLEGTVEQNGTVGFRQSTGNDVPLAEKAHIISEAFMAQNMKCARCHDSPINEYQQRDLFGLAAMLKGEAISIPETSSVGFVEGRRPPAISVTSKPGDLIQPVPVFGAEEKIQLEDSNPARAYRLALAKAITGTRHFAEVGVNRVWQRFMENGLVEPIDDWSESEEASHPELLEFLTDEFIASGYSFKRIEELILKSHAYQRKRDAALAMKKDSDGRPLYAALPMRRMRAEELVDSLHRTVGREFKTERMAYGNMDYGYPKRTWELVSLSNEEDTELLGRPLLQEIVTLAGTFGFREQRPDPLSVRDSDPNALQPLMIANGNLVNRLIKLTDASLFTRLANEDLSLEQFIERLFISIYSRPPADVEKQIIRDRLQSTWAHRRTGEELTSGETFTPQTLLKPDHYSAHLYVKKVREGEPPTQSLTQEFRKEMEEVLWVMLNSPKYLFVP